MQRIKAIPSKSDAHRALICAFLAGDENAIACPTFSEDIAATKACLAALRAGKTDLYPKESGSTFRFLLPVVAALSKSVTFHLEGRLPLRPLSPLYEELQQHGVCMSPQGTKDFKLSGAVKGGIFRIAGNVSSQFLTGLLLALPILKEDSKIQMIGTLESAPYVEMTLHTLKAFGIQIEKTQNGFFVPGNQQYTMPKEYSIEGDWSNAAFFLAAGAFLEEGILVEGISMDALQGDKQIVDDLKAFGAYVDCQKNGIFVQKGRLHGIEINASAVPDLVPVLALLGALAEGETVISHAERLKWKESNRLKSISEALSALGAQIEMTADGFKIQGKEKLSGGTIDSQNDHRIVMMAAIASLVCEKPVTIMGSNAVKKSYPAFFEDIKTLSLPFQIERM